MLSSKRIDTFHALDRSGGAGWWMVQTGKSKIIEPEKLPFVEGRGEAVGVFATF